MEAPMHRETQELIEQLVLPFYLVERDMLLPNQPEGQRRNENDAEHSWSLTVIACALAQHIDPSLDVGCIAQFGLVHDLVEVYSGDTSVWASDYDLTSKEEREAESFRLIKKQFSHFPWLIDTIEAYERQDTNEANYVKAMDKYIALMIRFLDGGEFYRAQGFTKERFEASLASHREKAHLHSGVGKYYEMIRADYDAHPEHFASG